MAGNLRPYLIISLAIFIGNVFFAKISLSADTRVMDKYLDEMESQLKNGIEEKQKEEQEKLIQEQISKKETELKAGKREINEIEAEMGEQQNMKISEKQIKQTEEKSFFSQLMPESFRERFAQAKLNIGISTGMSYDDNVFLRENNKEGDWIYKISPAFSFKVPSGDNYLSLDYVFNHDYYSNYHSYYQGHKVTGALFYKPSALLSFNLSGGFSRSQDINLFRLDPITLDALNRSRKNVNSSIISLETTYHPPWRLKDLFHLRFSNGGTKSQDIRTESQRVELDMEHFLTPIASIYLGYAFTKTDDKEEPTKDSDSQGTFLGFRYNLTNITKLDAKFSYDHLQYSDHTKDNGYKFGLNLARQVSPITDINLGYNWGVRNTISSNYRSYHINEVNLNLNHRFNPKLSFSLTAGYSIDTYLREDLLIASSIGDRERKKTNLGTGLKYQLSKLFSLGFDFDHSAVSSDFTGEPYTDNKYTLNLNAQF